MLAVSSLKSGASCEVTLNAGLRSNPGEARGLEGVLDTIATKPLGQFMLAVVAAGLACYGAYCFVEAKYRRVRV